MDILIELALLVIAAAIVVFFSGEFGKGVKKVFSWPGAPLLIPLAILSWAAVYFQKEVFAGFQWVRTKVRGLTQTIASLIPWEQGSLYIAKILILVLFSIVPVLCINLYLTRQKYSRFEYMHFTGILLWVFFAGVLISF